ncbi:AAA ATPase protein [Fadolivirus algeromassiliense]|jgi:hypothetical protein|uniref:AAA ATPase protein n=1 Tax=Fadolivirus FV1/VV64 TaxID=3070911 RepID=A0A7D3V5S7_9VIRU|nr:AAA ATPase protein [Fadolivirus algeromassiliense]QKF94415.1 AAA ATPase protein [Fadolivirus FV1/VV64]
MDFGEKLEERLKKLIERYGKRETPLPYDKNEEDNQDIEDNDLIEDDENEINEVDERYYEYYFHYDKRKDETFAFNEDFKIKKEKNNKQELYIIFYDDLIVNDLREILENSALFNDRAEISIQDLYHCINDLRIRYCEEKFHNDGMKKVIDFTTELFLDKYTKMDNMINEGIIDFDSLWYYLDKVDTIYKITHLDEDICFKYKYFALENDIKGDETLVLVGNVIAPFNGTLNVYTMEYNIKKFGGTKKLDTLKINKLKEEEYTVFMAYGNKVLDLYKSIRHMQMTGKQLIKQERGMLTRERHERVMVDYEGMSKYANSPFDFFLEKTTDPENIKDNEKLIVFPFACIYNLGISKEWGITHIKNLKDIDYKKDAIDYLVLEQNKKTLLKSLILNKAKSDKYRDFIESKGNGLVFLLYGPPGTGKTLTAEATCEFLGRPLYGINVGDLGTDPEHMEEIMNMVLEYSKRWNAIVVIDEVDIFLEERETNMIARNAMVGIFLKLLEYHDGIIFLTTNRLMSIDSAVKSRINLMLSYKELTDERRLKIWQSLLEKWNVKLSDKSLQLLSEYKLNGREIRNYVKLVLAVHEDQNMKITDKTFVKELEKCFEITEEFNAMVGKTNSMYL